MLRPYALLLLLWALYFHPLLLNPASTLFAPYSDLLAEHLPARAFLVREVRATGELPLWNPYHFCGSPFVHDIQVGTFYPPYAVTFLFPESAAGAAMSWVIALHVLAAGWFTLVYARHLGLGEAGSVVAGAGWMFAGKWMTHLLLAGHTITIGLAWLPLLLLGLERGARGGGVLPAVGAGTALALMTLGTHPQWTFYAAVFAVFWTLPPDRTHLRRWLLTGLGAGAVAAALAAVQLLPTLEAARYTARAAGLTSSEAVGVGVYTLFGLVGPGPAYDPPAVWEARGLLGLYLLAAAAASPALAPERGRYRLGVLLGLVAFACGGAALVDWLPGFNLFRVPSRVLVVAGFPLAVLAGVATDALARRAWDAATLRVVRRRVLLVLLLAAGPTLTCVAVVQATQPPRPMWAEFPIYWLVVAGTLPLMLGLAPTSATGRTVSWAVVLVGETLMANALFPKVRPQAEIYPPSGVLRFVGERLEPGTGRAMDWDVGSGPGDRLAAFGVGSPQVMLRRVESPRGYNPLDVRHYREFLLYVVGDPGPVLGLSPVAQPIVPNFAVTHPHLFDLLNVRYLAAAEGQEVPAGWRGVALDPAPPLVPAIPPNPPPHLPPHVVYERPSVFPRVWVVPEARAMPAGGELAALVATNFRRTVLLTTDRPLPPPAAVTPTARIGEYRPNRVRVELTGAGGGWLVLADVWYPGWTCRIDGVEVPVERANHAFRAVELPPGAKEAVFAFEPRSYRVGWWVSVVALAVVAVAAGAAGAYANCTPPPAGRA